MDSLSVGVLKYCVLALFFSELSILLTSMLNSGSSALGHAGAIVLIPFILISLVLAGADKISSQIRPPALSDLVCIAVYRSVGLGYQICQQEENQSMDTLVSARTPAGSLCRYDFDVQSELNHFYL